MAAIYTALAVVMTWPVAAHLGTRLASDVGDPAFTAWVLAWTTAQMREVLGGNLDAISRYWHGNIFHPEPLTLAYSEHLTAMALQVLPVTMVTDNILIAYNLLFISTFALSGLAVYLLVRELTGYPLAAFLAGLAYAYAPYRYGHLSHLQLLASYWMPLALFGFRRYFAHVTAGTGPRARAWALAGACAALVMQHLSCGYYMLFFAPFVAAYCLYEIVQRRVMVESRVWAELAVGAVAVAAATWPFVAPYFALRDLTTVGVRDMGEILMFSADTHAFASSAAPMLGRWGGFQPEGDGFPGFTILAFSALALVWGVWRLARTTPWGRMREWQFLAIVISAATVVLWSTYVLWLFVHGTVTLSLGSRTLIYSQLGPSLQAVYVGGLACLTLVTAARWRSRAMATDAFGFFAVAVVAAALFALGPRIEVMGRPVGPGPYAWLLHLPGFDGLRVPARMFMLVSLFLSVLAGLGAAVVLRTRPGQLARALVLMGAAGILFEGWMVPVPMNVPLPTGNGIATAPPPRVGSRIDPVYDTIRGLPDPVVLVEFPFGDSAYEPLAVFYAGYHRRALVNGYSGFRPPAYEDRLPAFYNAPDDPERLRFVLTDVGATHVLVHETAFLDDRGRRLSAWLLAEGAREVRSSNNNRLFALP